MMLRPGIESVRFRTGRSWLWGMLVALATGAGCHPDSGATVQLVVGRGDAGQRSFVPRTALARYVELPREHNELILTLSSYEASCERFVPPGAGQASVTVTIVTPPGRKPGAGSYDWSGPDPRGGTKSRPEHAYAEPTARIGSRSYIFPPGGSVQLKRVALDPHGRVDGLLAFEFPGDAERPAMSIKGRFHAKICRLDKAD
jgi:hypothetical protein